MTHVLAESIERRRFIYPDGFRSEVTMELVCSCGEKIVTEPDVTVSTAWDKFEAHRKEAPILWGMIEADNARYRAQVERGYN